MTDIESLRQRDKEFSIEEKLVCCVWVHDRTLLGKTYDDIQRDFEQRFHKKAPKHDLLIMWERNAFNSGSVNFNDNYHMISNGGGIGLQRSESPPPIKIDLKPHFESRNGVHLPYANSNHSNHSYSPPNNLRSKGPPIPPPSLTKRPLAPTLCPSPFPKNFNPALYKTELCRQYTDTGRCDYAEKCLFAHGKHELKHVQNYRTKLCLSWANGHCAYGGNCMFLHPSQPAKYTRKDSPSSYENRSGYYHASGYYDGHRAPKMARMSQY